MPYVIFFRDMDLIKNMISHLSPDLWCGFIINHIINRFMSYLSTETYILCNIEKALYKTV